MHYKNINDDISNGVVRLHVVGKDNEIKNQLLKLYVRDRILKDFSEDLSDCKSKAESLKVIDESKEKIKAAAEDELTKRGCNDKVKVEVGESRFPTKDYGNISLPSGRYTALKISIGEAEGRNWWCVMYPPLCISGNAEVTDAALVKLKASLTEEEYSIISQGKTPSVKYKFRIAEIIGKIFD